MACKPVERLTFFEIFKAHCSESDLGPISLNWFEELSAEAPPYEPKLLGELDGPLGCLDQTSFKTPGAKPSTYSQLVSTPPIFKEQILPPYSSPGKEVDQKKIEASRENLTSPSITRRKIIDQENEILASPPGTCHNFLAASPAILRNTYRTPQRNNIPGPYGSLFCTPKLLEVRTPKRISESLGAEVDPDMSWSSSLATPPTLGATVIIARENDSISGAKQQDGRADILSHNFFSNHDKCPGTSDASMLPVPETVELNAEDDIKDFESEMLNSLFGKMDSFEDTFSMPVKSSGTLLLPHALDTVEKCEITTDTAQGEGDVPSEQPNRGKIVISQEVETTRWTEKSHFIELKDSLLQNTDGDTGDGKDGCLIGYKELESLRIAGDRQDCRTCKSFENEKPVREMQSSSSQWSQLNSPDLDVTHLEMSICSSPPSDLCREKNLEEKTVLMTKDDAMETSLLNTSDLIKTQKLLSVNLSEKCYEVKASENNPTSEITPIKSVSLSVQDPKLVKGCAAEKVSKMSFLNCNSLLIESTNVTEYSVVYNGSFSKHLKATSKSVITDVLSHPLVCSATSPNNGNDLHLINNESTLTESGLKSSLNMLSSLRKRSKRFIYTINNTLLYQEEEIEKEVTSESPIHPVLPHSESDSYEFQGCHVASDEQGCLLLAERKCLQSNIEENKFGICTLKMDILGNSSGNSFNDRLKQQDLRDLRENAREDQSATSLKTLDISNTWKEDITNSLNSEITSNIKRKVLASACLMARKHSELFPKGCSLEKGKKDKYMGANVNDGGSVPWNLKEELAWSLPKNSEHLIDTHHGTTSVTDNSFNNTLSQINIGMNGVSSDCCNEVSTDKRLATDQWSVASCREALGPLGVNCSENYSTGLKQEEETHVAASSEVRANNGKPKSAENSESPQAADFSNVAVEMAKESIDCIDDNSSNKVICEEGKQVAPMYSSKKPIADLNYKGKSSGSLNAHSLNLSFGGFQTASNKQIKFSEVNIAKGRMLFKDIENECFEACSMERVSNFSNQDKKESMFSSDSESNLASSVSDSLDPQTNFLKPRHTQFTPHKIGLCKSFPRSPQSLQETNQTLTASQEAEIAELSSILEETGSQFEFTQFRKQSNMIQSHAFQQFGTVGTCGRKNVENNSEKRKYAGFCSTLKTENQVKTEKYCMKQEDTNEDSDVVEYKKENAVVFHKNDKKVTFANLNRNESRISNESFPVAKGASFSHFVGFSSAGGKKINISKAALNRSAELFRDLDDDNYLFKSSKTSTRYHHLNSHMSSTCNFVRCLEKEKEGKMVCVSDFKSIDTFSHSGSVSHHAQKKDEENISTLFKENEENQTKRSIKYNENASFSSTNTIISSVSFIKNCNQNHKTSKQFLNQGGHQIEGSLKEDSLDVTCVGDAITGAEEQSVNIVDEIKNLSPNQKGEDRKESECLSPKCRSPSGGDKSISVAALNHSLHLINVQCAERDVNVLDNSHKLKANCKNMEEDTTHDKILLENESRIKVGSYHHQIPVDQEVNVEKNEVDGSYLTGFHTASGKKITIADGLLAKAEQFFAENVDVRKEHNDYFENPIKKRKCGKNCVKYWDLRVESTVQCDPDKLNKKLVPEEPGNQFKQAVESSPIKQAVLLDTVKVDTSFKLGERSLLTSYTCEKADVRPGKSELELLPGQERDALSRTCLSEDEKLFVEREMEYSPKKRDDSENMRDSPVRSAASLNLMEVSNDLEDNSVPGVTKDTLFAEDRNNISDQSLLLTSKSNHSHLSCDSTEFDLEHLNELCADPDGFMNTTVDACQNQSLVGLPEDETNLARLKETALSVENQKGDLKQIVFSTAKGKAVPVSESTLARVREMFQDNYSESVKYESNLRTSQTKITGNTSAIIHAECPNSFKFLNAAGSKEINSSTSHFIKVHASASESYHQDINISADAKPVSNSQMQCFEHNSKLLGHLPIPGNQLKESDSSTSSHGFFSTASGKPVQLSEESLRKAWQLFSEMEGNQSSHVQEALLVEEGVEKSEMHTEVVPRKMQIMLPRGEEISSTELISGPAFGFSTASGKQVKVSKNAYQKAKAILEECDDFLSSGLCITDRLSSIKESDQHVESVTDKVISESKVEKSSNEDFDVESIGLEEMKSFPGTHHVEMPEYVAHGKKNKQLTYKSNFQEEETRAFGKGQLNLGTKMESEAVSCIVTAKAERNINLQTPNSYLEMEAIESARAFMEDDLSSSGAQINAAQSFSGRLDENIQNKTFGKRHFEEENSLGEPPIKRQLLLEFNKTQNSPRSLKASKSTPDGIFKDRRKFIYHVPLKPVTCQPFGATEERQEVKNPTLTLPDQDFKGFKSKPAIFQHCAIRQSSNGTLGVSTPCKASTKESEETRRLYESGKTAKTFIPPFKTKLTFSTGEQCSSKRCDSPISKGMTEEMELNQITTEPNIAEPQDHQFCIQHEADTDLENGNLDLVKMMTNLHCARDLQEMRIKKKYRQHITSQPGSLYVIKTSARNRISLKAAVEEKSPSFYSAEELYTYGVSKHCIQVNSTNAESFQFLIKDFFSKEYILAGNGMQLADGGWLIPTDEGQAGKKEFYRALCDTPGVDPKLITEAWVYNHYRWIVWKLAAMEVSFPHEFANKCLTPERVLLQLKYRYDLEVDKSKRSAIKKITERDDAAGKTVVLCISKIVSLNTVVSLSGSNKNVESKKAAAIIEVTDGWYGIRALLDPPLKAFLRRGRLTVGQKIIVHGAELVGSQNGCTPLEAPDSLMLKISANSTRCARWHAKLGFHSDPRPFPLPLSSLYSEGGAVGCVDVVVQRTYPIQWMEKTSAGSYIFRNSRAEEREAAKHAEGQQKELEALFAKIQAEYEKHEERTSRTLRSRIVTRQQIRNLQDGAELYEAIQNASDPDYMEGYLSEDQLKALNAYRQLMSDKKQTQIQEEFKKALESAAQEENGCSKRDVSTVWKLCVVDYRKQEKHKGVLLSIWRPLLDVYSLLKEGSRYRIYHLSTSQSKARSDSTKIQLTATKKTQYLQLSVSQEMLAQVFFPRQALNFTSLSDPSFQPPCAEVDLVGVVISISRTGFATTVYLSDESYNLVAVKIWTDLRHFAIEDIVVRCAFISASNLQWQSEFRSEIPMLLAGDLSVFSSSPKESYLLEKVNGLRSTIENVASFCSDAESKLMNLLRRTLFLTPSLTKRCGLECASPFCNSGLYAEEKSLISSKTKIKHPSPLSTSTPNMKFVTRGSAKTPSPATINDDHHPKSSKKRKAMDFLSCIPTPPPLTPMYSVISPSLKKAFQPPRSLGLQHSNSSKETNQNIGHVTPCRKLRETVHLPENDLVADEELAMINTQALMNNLPEEKKIEYVNENSNAIATNLSDNLIPKGNSRSTRQANNSSKSSSEVAEALQKDTEEPDDLLPAHRMLQR